MADDVAVLKGGEAPRVAANSAVAALSPISAAQRAEAGPRPALAGAGNGQRSLLRGALREGFEKDRQGDDCVTIRSK